MTPSPSPKRKKKTPKRMKYFVNVIILVKFFLKKQVLSGSFDDLLMSSDHD